MNKTNFLCILLAALVVTGCTASVSTIQISERPHQALLLIDVQKGVLSPDGPASLGGKRSDALIRSVNRVIDEALKENIPIAFVKNEWPGWRFVENWWFGGAFKKGSEWAQIDNRLLTNIPESKRTIFSKSFPSAFSNPDVQKWLEDNRTGEIIIAGLYGDKCVTSTALGALERGYAVRLVPDGIVTQDEAELHGVITRLKEKGATLLPITQTPSTSKD